MNNFPIKIMNDFCILVLSCDKYEPCWKPFFTLLDKYYPEHPKTYLVTETLITSYTETINVNSDIWTERFRMALEQIKYDKVLVLLDDFFIRSKVNVERINYVLNNFTEETFCYNMEKEYRDPAFKLKNWDIQKNNQVYLNSCQPSIFDRKKLIERLQTNLNPQQWETQKIDSPYLHYINNGDFIIDIGYNHTLNWGISRGKITDECLNFLRKENINTEELERSFR